MGFVYQTVHDRRLVGGHLARVPVATMGAYMEHPLLQLLRDSLPCGDERRRRIEERLEHDQVRWIVARRPRDVERLRGCLQLEGRAAGDGLVVFAR